MSSKQKTNTRSRTPKKNNTSKKTTRPKSRTTSKANVKTPKKANVKTPKKANVKTPKKTTSGGNGNRGRNPFNKTWNSLRGKNRLELESQAWLLVKELWRLGKMGNHPAQWWGDTIHEAGVDLDVIATTQYNTNVMKKVEQFVDIHIDSLDGFTKINQLLKEMNMFDDNSDSDSD